VRTGTMLAGHRFDSLIGEGATGAVHLAEDTKHELRVTVKAYKLPAARGVQKLDRHAAARSYSWMRPRSRSRRLT